MSVLHGIELEWNDKDGTIEIADDQAPNQDKTRVVAEMHIHEFGEEIVAAVNASGPRENLLRKALEEMEWAENQITELVSESGHAPYAPGSFQETISAIRAELAGAP